MKLKNKINLYTAFLFAILLIVMNLSIYYSFNKLILDSELNTAKNEMAQISNNIGKTIGSVPDAVLLRAYVPLNGMIQIVTEDNTSLSTVTSSDEQQLINKKILFYVKDLSQTISYNQKLYTFISAPIIMQDGKVANLQIIKSLEPARDILTTLRWVLIMVTLITLIPVLISSKVLSNLITKPVSTMIKTMTDIRQSGQFKRLELDGKSMDELYQMGDTFNHMMELIEVNFEKQQQFVSNASHELKTPLTIIESYSSLLKRRGLKEPELFAESIDAIHSEAIRMQELTEQLLLLAQNHEQWNIEISKLNLPEWLIQIVSTFETAFNRRIELVQDLTKPMIITTDEKKLKQLLFIFLDNARKYSHSSITISTGLTSDSTFIKIIDSGIGIREEELPKVFDRFYRVDKARSRKLGGTGLGLSIAKEISAAMGISLQLVSQEGTGTTATLYIKN
ncbi:cell wall metabolism sensor histidine kinase WalK [Bacillus sp. MRMR6]|uniref:sensor histidine kinase n=1 Tax=Bacillus sp. MRMR6 TaxID=1928617 RepID=UPI000951F24D|nr:HAMP domain-containing sensor histidine kinase [Bacillus sp. MRMR6]OLS41859.1 two-component sensor histidine kinase [Bacillus sp. MRMR6]